MAPSNARRRYVRISDATPNVRRRLNARRATADSARSRCTETSPRPRRWMLPAVWKRPESSASRSQSLRGAMPASSLRRSSESDTFEGEQSLLVLDAERAVRADPVRTDDTVAGNDDAEPV